MRNLRSNTTYKAQETVKNRERMRAIRLKKNNEYFRKEMAQGLLCRRDEHFRKYLLFLVILIQPVIFVYFVSRQSK